MAVMIGEAPRCATRILVCGGRHYADEAHVFRILDGLHNGHPIDLIIQGGASGADTLARTWARRNGVNISTFAADWSKGRGAGPIRNQRMLDEAKPDLVIAFPGGRGTADMLRRAREAGVDWMRCAAPVGTRPEGGDTEGGSMRSTSDAVPKAGAQPVSQRLQGLCRPGLRRGK